MNNTCPICGGPLSEDEARFESHYGDKTMQFCSKECLVVFNHFPEAYAGEYEPELNVLEDTRP